MAVKKLVKKPVLKTGFKKNNHSEIQNEIKAVKEVLKIKKEQTVIDTEITESIEAPPVETNTVPIETPPVETNTEPQPKQTPIENSTNFSLESDLSEQTQEDLDKKTTAETINETLNSENITQRVEGLTDDDFPTNEGGNEEEDTPEYRREMSKIKASALVEFFDVIFMIICLVVSKDFSDKNQEKFTLVKARKNAIKSNVFQIMAFSKKKHNPMGTLIFLIIFSYIPLVVMAIMERIKTKKIEQEKKIQEEKEKIYNLQQNQNNPINTPFVNFNNSVNPVIENKPKKKGRPKIITIEKNTGSEVKLMKDGTYKNLQTGQKYSGGRGRMPLWVKNYIGKIG